MNTTAQLERKTAVHGVPWEDAYAYYQAVQVKDVIYVSGQLSHDKEGNFVAPATLDTQGKPADFSAMEAQMRQTYKNAISMLAEFGATLDDVVEETLFVLDVDAAFAVASKVRSDMYGRARPLCASNLIGVSRLALPVQLIEISFRAVLK
ncbi:RidA family protein [Massilia sp. DD77]|uniref:RidA family protein n=1 Tax=Massilia sp. DD77 TaxID=3109349 RepID=UPI002FFE6C11